MSCRCQNLTTLVNLKKTIKNNDISISKVETENTSQLAFKVISNGNTYILTFLGRVDEWKIQYIGFTPTGNSTKWFKEKFYPDDKNAFTVYFLSSGDMFEIIAADVMKSGKLIHYKSDRYLKNYKILCCEMNSLIKFGYCKG